MARRTRKRVPRSGVTKKPVEPSVATFSNPTNNLRSGIANGLMGQGPEPAGWMIRIVTLPTLIFLMYLYTQGSPVETPLHLCFELMALSVLLTAAKEGIQHHLKLAFYLFLISNILIGAPQIIEAYQGRSASAVSHQVPIAPHQELPPQPQATPVSACSTDGTPVATPSIHP